MDYVYGMEDYKRGSHTVWACKYHLVWTTKYRYQVLGGDVGQRCRELLREIARSKEMVIYAGSINRDHVHMLIAIPPQISVSRSVQFLKGKSSHKLLTEYRSLKKRYWGQQKNQSPAGEERAPRRVIFLRLREIIALLRFRITYNFCAGAIF